MATPDFLADLDRRSAIDPATITSAACPDELLALARAARTICEGAYNGVSDLASQPRVWCSSLVDFALYATCIALLAASGGHPQAAPPPAVASDVVTASSAGGSLCASRRASVTGPSRALSAQTPALAPIAPYVYDTPTLAARAVALEVRTAARALLRVVSGAGAHPEAVAGVTGTLPAPAAAAWVSLHAAMVACLDGSVAIDSGAPPSPDQCAALEPVARAAESAILAAAAAAPVVSVSLSHEISELFRRVRVHDPSSSGHRDPQSLLPSAAPSSSSSESGVAVAVVGGATAMVRRRRPSSGALPAAPNLDDSVHAARVPSGLARDARARGAAGGARRS